jgi:hypothetical protein
MITIAALPLTALGLVAGCASGHPSSAPSTPAAATHSASAAPTQHFTYTTAAALVAALKAHGVKFAYVRQEGAFTDLGNNTVARVFDNSVAPVTAANVELKANGGTVIVGTNWFVSTTPKVAFRVQQALGGSFIGTAPVSPAQASAAKAAAKASQEAAAAKKARQQAAHRLASTVTYVVTGTPGAQVTYGPAGSNFTGTVPMTVDAHIPNNPPIYYAIDAQLQGGGQVSCQILVAGKVISSANASGGFNIATCEIGQNPITGQWENDNNG